MHENGQYGHIYYTYDEKGNLTKIRRVSSTTKDYYVTTNIQKDVEAIYDANGNLQCRYVYDSWGKTKFVVDGNGNEVSGNNIGYINSIRYRGYYLDRETGYYYLQSRYYDPDTTRFINADDINYLNADILGTNLYIYCLNNCVNDSDSTGTIASKVIGAIIGAVIGAIGGYYLGNWLANKLGLKKFKQIFILIFSLCIGATASYIGYKIGPYVRNCWSYIQNGLVNLLNKSYNSIAKITLERMKNKINVPKHAWNRVLNKVTNEGIINIIHKAIKYGKWEIGRNGSIYINYYYKKEIIRMSGKIINGIFYVSDAWVVTK